jgi:uncharacterized protein
MSGRRMSAKVLALLIVLPLCAALLLPACQALQRKALFFPSHHDRDNGLARWTVNGEFFGFSREVSAPENIWLMLHGNGGQAADRVYALGAFSPRDSVFILEYPGYGRRAGKPSRRSIDAAALAAYQALRAQFSGKPVCVAGESLGSGPASTLVAASPAPDKLVFIVPYEDLKSVARDYAPYAPLGLLLAGSWNNVEALSDYHGPMDVFGAERDEVIDVRHARALAASRPQAKFHLLPGGHNQWADQPELRIRCP